jgi:hypothetical protein
MNGTLVELNFLTSIGYIITANNERIQFKPKDWKSPNILPKIGLNVDFDIIEGYAVNITATGRLTAKKRSVYLNLIFYLGFLGIHDFYAGYRIMGLTKIVIFISALFFIIFANDLHLFVFIPGLVILLPLIWAYIQALVVKKDSHGIAFV